MNKGEAAGKGKTMRNRRKFLRHIILRGGRSLIYLDGGGEDQRVVNVLLVTRGEQVHQGVRV